VDSLIGIFMVISLDHAYMLQWMIEPAFALKYSLPSSFYACTTIRTALEALCFWVVYVCPCMRKFQKFIHMISYNLLGGILTNLVQCVTEMK